MLPSVGYAKVKYITEHQENDRPMSLEYSKFLSFLFTNFKILDKEKILKDLNEHQVVLLDNETGEHFIKNIYEDAFKANFKTLTKLNIKNEETATPFYDKVLAQTKTIINNFQNPFKNDRYSKN
jgi:hypothetical protein